MYLRFKQKKNWHQDILEFDVSFRLKLVFYLVGQSEADHIINALVGNIVLPFIHINICVLMSLEIHLQAGPQHVPDPPGPRPALAGG